MSIRRDKSEVDCKRAVIQQPMPLRKKTGGVENTATGILPNHDLLADINSAGHNNESDGEEWVQGSSEVRIGISFDNGGHGID